VTVKRRRLTVAFVVAAILVLGIGASLYGFYQSVLPNLRIVRVGMLWRSGQPNALGLRVAYWAGVKTILCLRDGDDAETKAEEEFAKSHGMLFIQNQLRYSGQNLDEAVPRFLEVVSDARRQPVLVHCSRGKERTGICAAVFRMEFDGWTNEQALEEMYALGFDRDTLPELERYVASYRPQERSGPPAVAAGSPYPATPTPTEPQEPLRATP